MSINPEREEKYLFSEPYTVSPGVIVVKEDDDSISSFDDLDGKTTAQSLTSNWYTLAQDSGATVEAVEGWAQAVALLEQGRVDATINDNLTYLDYETTNGPTGLKIAAETDDPALQRVRLHEGQDGPRRRDRRGARRAARRGRDRRDQREVLRRRRFE